MEAVRKQYEGTDKWMKAPNGKPTKLNERQWLQVRTPNFKKWFGNWDIPNNRGSKILDENGEPLIVYHGTGTTINEFKYEYTNQGNDQYNSGFYLTNDYDTALGYTKAILS